MNLNQWMADRDKSDAWLAEQIGVSRPYISRIRRGERQASLKVALKLSEVTTLPASAFLKDRAA